METLLGEIVLLKEKLEILQYPTTVVSQIEKVDRYCNKYNVLLLNNNTNLNEGKNKM